MCINGIQVYLFISQLAHRYHWGKADDRNRIHGHPKMSDEKLGQYLFYMFKGFYTIFLTKHTLERCKFIKYQHGNHKWLPRNVYETGN